MHRTFRRQVWSSFFIRLGVRILVLLCLIFILLGTTGCLRSKNSVGSMLVTFDPGYVAVYDEHAKTWQMRKTEEAPAGAKIVPGIRSIDVRGYPDAEVGAELLFSWDALHLKTGNAPAPPSPASLALAWIIRICGIGALVSGVGAIVFLFLRDMRVAVMLGIAAASFGIGAVALKKMDEVPWHVWGLTGLGVVLTLFALGAKYGWSVHEDQDREATVMGRIQGTIGSLFHRRPNAGQAEKPVVDLE